MTLRIEHPRALVALLFVAVLCFAALLEYDNWALDHAIVELRYCRGRLLGGSP